MYLVFKMFKIKFLFYNSIRTYDIFIENKSIEEIQDKYQYSSRHNAQNQKYKCVEQIKKIKNNSIFVICGKKTCKNVKKP